MVVYLAPLPNLPYYGKRRNVGGEQLMKLWLNVSQYVTELLALGLIFRLLWLRNRENSVYAVFIGFLIAELTGTLGYFACERWKQLDYRVFYFISIALLAAFSLLLVYSLSKAVLAELPGILRFSRFLLNTVFLLAILLAFSTSRSEYLLTPSKTYIERVDRLIFAFVVADKGIAMASVVILVVILAFILWFPVKMSKNLAIFSIGLVVYFASKTGLELVKIYVRFGSTTMEILDIVFSGVLSLCFCYWIAFLDSKGSLTTVRIGHGWQPEEQEKLIKQLESLNGALMRSSQQLRSGQHLPQ